MKDELFDLKRVMEEGVLDGVFEGKWSGYVVKFKIYDARWEARTNCGIRGTVDCTVTVKDGKATVET